MKRIIFATVLGFCIMFGVSTLRNADTTISVKNDVQESIFKLVIKSVDGNRGSGTGFLFTHKNKNYIMTNYHVCSGASNDEILVLNKSTQRIKKIVLKNVNLDLCILQGVETGVPLKLTNTYPPRESKLFVAGHPWGGELVVRGGYYISTANIKLPYFETINETECKSKGIGFEFHTVEVEPFIFEVCIIKFNVLQITVPVYPGNSGSPLMDKNKNVVGLINSSNIKAGVSYAIPMYQIIEFLNTNL